jgi:hypothetical protein
MKIAIIGKGTSAIITALKCIQKGHEITFFYDPNTPHIGVGESTTPIVPKLVADVLDISSHELVKRGIASYKMGINFVNWGNNKQFYHNFESSIHAIHFDTKIFNEFIHNHLLETKKASYVAKRIEDVNELLRHFQFVVNCAGWEDKSTYIEPVFKSVNSAVLFKKELNYDRHNDSIHTLHLATEDGWQFGIPFPDKNLLKCGYLFNSDLISEDEVKSKLDYEVTRTFSWTQRYAKEIIPKPNVAINGNRLFFLEPLQALSLHFVDLFSNFICDYLEEPSELKREWVNSKYLIEMWIHQICLSYHYQYGSSYDSEFWNKTATNAADMMKYQFNGPDEVLQHNINFDRIHKGGTQSKIGPFTWNDHLVLQKGLR